MLSFPQEETVVTCPPLCDLVAPYFAVSGCDLMLSGALFKDPCARFGRLLWGV